MRRSTTTEVCPVCGAASPLRIIYGMPDSELFARAERGLVVLGGCCVEDDDAEFRCSNEACRAEW